ncbi:metal-dependent protein hydrolase [Pavlovales sp. CCMP2436]|nr:metal-dependent protein hydrolase [Pavlovales sp. CCMP2436]
MPAKRPRYAPRLDSALARIAALAVHSTMPAAAPPPLLGTHDGHFHCDEALACAMLAMLPEFGGHALLRTRDAPALATCKVLVDVGGVYDPPSKRFDHHQRGFDQTLSECGRSIKLSSAGLVWRHYGKALLAQLTQPEALPPADLDVLYAKVYTDFVEHLDGIDNGVDAGVGGQAYAVGSSLPARVNALNPAWNEEASPEELNEQFKTAMELAGGELVSCVLRLCTQWWPARRLVADALAETEVAAAALPAAEARVRKQLLQLDGGGCPWQGHLLALEEERKVPLALAVKYVLYADSRGQWRVQATPTEEGGFHSKLPLPEPWRGVRDEALSALVGLDGCVFVHAAGFIGGHQTREGALQLACKALALLGAS